jgi:transposase-like protein
MSEQVPGPAGGGRPKAGRRRKRLSLSQKYEVFTSVLTHSATQSELAESLGVDRSTIRSICAVAKQGALAALAAAVPGRRAKDPRQAELADAKARIAALESTVCEQAMKLHLVEGKEGWD